MRWLGKWKVVCACICVLAACGTPPKAKPQSLLKGVSCPESSSLRYENFGHGFFLTWCNGCHSDMLKGDDRAGAPEDVNFNRIEQIQAHAERIFQRIKQGDMPPGAVLSDDLIANIREWLSCGARASIAPKKNPSTK